MVEPLREAAYNAKGARVKYSGSLDRKHKECPNCPATGTIGKVFGIRLNGNWYVPQPWCKKCRRISARSSPSRLVKSTVKAVAASIAKPVGKRIATNTKASKPIGSTKKPKPTMAEKRARLKRNAQSARKKGKGVIASTIALMLLLCLSLSASAKQIAMNAVDPDGNPTVVMIEVTDAKIVKPDMWSKISAAGKAFKLNHPRVTFLVGGAVKVGCWGVSIGLNALHH